MGGLGTRLERAMAICFFVDLGHLVIVVIIIRWGVLGHSGTPLTRTLVPLPTGYVKLPVAAFTRLRNWTGNVAKHLVEGQVMTYGVLHYEHVCGMSMFFSLKIK